MLLSPTLALFWSRSLSVEGSAAVLAAETPARHSGVTAGASQHKRLSTFKIESDSSRDRKACLHAARLGLPLRRAAFAAALFKEIREQRLAVNDSAAPADSQTAERLNSWSVL